MWIVEYKLPDKNKKQKDFTSKISRGIHDKIVLLLDLDPHQMSADRRPLPKP